MDTIPYLSTDPSFEANLAYIADTFRDAETLAQTIDAPIIIRQHSTAASKPVASLPNQSAGMNGFLAR